MLALKRQFHNIVLKIAWDISGIPALMTGIYCYCGTHYSGTNYHLSAVSLPQVDV